jgi:hypothetical protein
MMSVNDNPLIEEMLINEAITRLVDLRAERDRAIRQRDHARATAHAWYVYFLSAGEQVMDAPDCPDWLSKEDDDGWDCQSLTADERRIIGCPP